MCLSHMVPVRIQSPTTDHCMVLEVSRRRLGLGYPVEAHKLAHTHRHKKAPSARIALVCTDR